jgi:hypothetical protein
MFLKEVIDISSKKRQLRTHLSTEKQMGTIFIFKLYVTFNFNRCLAKVGKLAATIDDQA